MTDLDDRKRIRESLDESLIVEAAAGTGKTSELVRRVVAVLQTGRTTVARIVAVTFTRKAAGELKLRLREALDLARSETQDPQEIQHLERAMAELEEARIGTIHSFCADLLRERPVEARVDPAFEEASEEEASRLLERAFRPWIEEKLSNMPPGLQRALSRSMLTQSFDGRSPLDRIRDAAWKLLEWRDFQKQWRREPFPRQGRIDALVTSVQQLCTMSFKCRNWEDNLQKGLRPIRDLAMWIYRAEKEKARQYDRLEALLLTLLREMKRPQNQRKGRGYFAEGLSRQEVIDSRESLIAQLEDFKLQADADLAALLQMELQELANRYEDLKRRSGKLDFVDLLIHTRDLIRDNDPVRRHFQERFTHIFVDEFQDTDPLQAEIMLLLSADDPEECDWMRVRPVAGKLFLVGDPKQSIYRFRRADVLLYQQIKEALTERGVGLVHLTQSFRSVPTIQKAVNAAFGSEMQGDSSIGQPEYVALDEYRPDQERQPALVVLPAPAPYSQWGRLTNKAIETCLPDAVAAFVDWLVNESDWKVSEPENPEQSIPVSPRHVCILFRRFVSWFTDVTRDYTRALEARRIPHLLVGSRSFHQREEVQTLRVALTAIEWPDDELSVYATLRGSLFWIRDSLLLRFRDRHGSLHPFRPIPEDLGEDLQPITQALEVLRRLHRRRNRRPIVDTLNELLEVTRAHAGFALRPAGHQVLANVQRVCDLARHFEVGGGFSFRAFVDYLESESEKPTSKETPVLEEGIDGVRLMTVHSAKGLEFPVVILADMTTHLSASQADKYVSTEKGLAAFRLLGCSPWDLLDYEDEEKLRDEAEGVRITYVAATRARDLLVLPAVGDEVRDGWLRPFNKVIYPPKENWRKTRPAPGCPRFGSSSVAQRPVEFDGREEFSVHPGLHNPEVGEHSVVWWDPSVLNLNVQPNFGLHQEQILKEDEGGKAASEGLKAYEEWRDRREQTLRVGSRPSLEVFTVTGTPDLGDPPETGAIQVEILKKSEERPTGARFGTLVHTVLRDANLGADEQDIARLAQLHGRVLDATEDEISSAAEAVRSTLRHVLLKKAATAKRCHRELPILLKLDQNQILEGTIDLAFMEEDHWIVIDFKTDADLDSQQPRYKRQLQWYLYSLYKITKTRAEGWLLGI